MGEMSNFRKALVQNAFKSLDKDKTGQLSLEDIKGIYNASKHPEVLIKRKTEEDVLTSFLDTIEQYYSFIVNINNSQLI